MPKNEGYRNYQLEENVVSLIDSEKKDNGISKDFTINKAIEYYFENRTINNDGHDYKFETKGRSDVYFYLKRENHNLLEEESSRYEIPFNWIINEAVKFYINNKS